MSTEIWKHLPMLDYGSCKYEISSFGKVKSLARVCIVSDRWGNEGVHRPYKERILSTLNGGCGYRLIVINRVSHFVCELVALAFLGPCPEGYEVAFGDGNKKNNHIENLSYQPIPVQTFCKSNTSKPEDIRRRMSEAQQKRFAKERERRLSSGKRD